MEIEENEPGIEENQEIEENENENENELADVPLVPVFQARPEFLNNETLLTGYAVHTAANRELRKLSLTTIEPQMIYGYIASGLIKTVLVKVDDEKPPVKRVRKSEAERWVNKYVAARVRKQQESLDELVPEETDEESNAG